MYMKAIKPNVGTHGYIRLLDKLKPDLCCIKYAAVYFYLCARYLKNAQNK